MHDQEEFEGALLLHHYLSKATNFNLCIVNKNINFMEYAYMENWDKGDYFYIFRVQKSHKRRKQKHVFIKS